MTPTLHLPSAHNVAALLRERIVGAGDVKVHKLLYYAQGWHLAILGSPLFGEDIEAWANGPVVERLWRDEKYHRPASTSQPIAPESLEIIDFVIGHYGSLFGKDLIRLTHLEAPWKDVAESDAIVWSNEITHEALGKHFRGLGVPAGLDEPSRRARSIARSLPAPASDVDEYDELEERLRAISG